MLAPPPGGSPWDTIDPATPNIHLVGVKKGWDAINETINGGFATGFADLEQMKSNGDALFFPWANV